MPAIAEKSLSLRILEDEGRSPPSYTAVTSGLLSGGLTLILQFLWDIERVSPFNLDDFEIGPNIFRRQSSEPLLNYSMDALRVLKIDAARVIELSKDQIVNFPIEVRKGIANYDNLRYVLQDEARRLESGLN